MSITELEAQNKNLQETKNGKNINICYSSDTKYAKYLYISMASVLANKNDDEKISFYILDGGMTESDRCKLLQLKHFNDCEIEFINVDENRFSMCPMDNTKCHLSIVTYYRLLIADLLPHTNKLLYLDCDLEVKTSLKELYDTDIENCYFAGIDDVKKAENCKRLNLIEYCNAGVLVLNLDLWRKTGFTEKIFDWIKEHSDELLFHDQDVLNMYCQNAIKIVDEKWNAQVRFTDIDYDKKIKNSNIVHYIAHDKGAFVYNAAKYIFKSDYKKELIKMYFQRFVKTIGQFFFRLRNSDEETKELVLLGMRFHLKRK